MDNCSACVTASTQQVPTTGQPDCVESKPPALCAGTPSKPPVEVKTVNLWDARAREEHALAYFAYTQRRAEERRAAKRAADPADEKASHKAQPLSAAPKEATVCHNMDNCSACVTASTQQVPTTGQPDCVESKPPALCAGTPSKPPVEVKTVNLWDARELKEHTLSHFAFTQQLAEERRSAKRAAESAKDQVSDEPQPLSAAPRETIACGTIMDSCSVRVHPTKCNSSLNVLVSMDDDVPCCTKGPVMMRLIRRWATRQYLHRFADALAVPIIPAPPLAEVMLLGNAIQPPCQDDCSGPSAPGQEGAVGGKRKRGSSKSGKRAIAAKQCAVKGCSNPAKRKWCGEHKRFQVCRHQGCSKAPIYNIPGAAAQWCREHKTGDMQDVAHKRCMRCGLKIPKFGTEDGRPTHCGDCKTADMRDVGNNKCKACRLKQPIFVTEEGYPTHCGDCKTADMRDVISRMCEGCSLKRPCFGVKDGSPTHCGDCKTAVMRDVAHKSVKLVD
ncbi:hypothetical protein JKP88DRAFT_300058 [Tribonema minus]|uniref:Uncharacterized protein n=1 Tax=Tribonema minus TaxID=303371 RepID=A0A835ZBE1_9STRA|nr:hypothetical protein JKP88DRAFT_300058 [Tribonema minus]